jgi:hypothetical protein
MRFDGLRVARVSNSDHICDMASRTRAFLISQHDDVVVVRCAVPGLPVFLGSITPSTSMNLGV